MKVLACLHNNGLNADPIYNLGFEKYENIGRDCYLFLGDAYAKAFEEQYYDKERIFLSLEEPNFCTDVDGPHAKLYDGWGSTRTNGELFQSKPVDKVLTLCPYTAECFENRTAVFFPFNEDLIPKTHDKIYDVIYTGGVPAFTSWGSFLDVMYKYNFRDVHYSRGTNPSCSYHEKLELYAKTKISLCHGLAIAYPEHINRYKSFPKSQQNKAFSHLHKNLMPQIKSRVFESAFSKSIILYWKDPWNTIENFFEPEKEFIYFENEIDLKQKIDDILSNYERYQIIAENAYNKAINNYTTKHFVDKYLK